MVGFNLLLVWFYVWFACYLLFVFGWMDFVFSCFCLWILCFVRVVLWFGLFDSLFSGLDDLVVCGFFGCDFVILRCELCAFAVLGLCCDF